MDVPMHEAPLERQASVAAAEAELLVNAFEGSVPVPPSKAVAAMRAEGVVQMDGVMNCTTARALRAHVCARLQEIQSGDESPTDCERLLGQIMCRRMRWDLKLDLADAVVSAALEQTLAVLGQPLVSLLGCGARLFELGALAVDAGAPRQPVHPDTPFSSAISFRSSGKSTSCFFFLPFVLYEAARRSVITAQAGWCSGGGRLRMPLAWLLTLLLWF